LRCRRAAAADGDEAVAAVLARLAGAFVDALDAGVGMTPS